LILELIQLEIGISTNRYLPAIGTAGLLLLAVKGYNLEPAPPPRITDRISLLIMSTLFGLSIENQNSKVKIKKQAPANKSNTLQRYIIF